LKLANLSMEDTIKTILDNPNMCPCLLLGKYVTEFKKLYRDRIFQTYKLEDIRNLVYDYSGYDNLDGKFMVIDGIGFLNEMGQNALLKFIEESTFPIILLSYYDKVMPTILSRTKFIFKKPIKEVTNLKFVKVKDALALVEEKKKSPDFTEMDEIALYAEICPAAFVLKYSAAEYDHSANKILKMMCNV